MSDDPRVTVPAELVDALREAVRVVDQHTEYIDPNDKVGIENGILYDRAAALVDATERPFTETPEPEMSHNPAISDMTIRSISVVNEADAFSPDCRIEVAPVPVSDEAEAAASESWSRMGVEFVEGKRTMLPDWSHYAPAFIAGFRAARQAGKDEQP